MSKDPAGQAGRGLRTYEGAVAVITGGASGIGAAMGRALAARGATVVLADRQLELAQREVAALFAAGGRAEAAELDVRDAAAVEALAEEVLDRHGRIDYLFNNAGIAIGGEVADLTLQDWRTIVEVNLMGVIHGVAAFYPRMLRQGFGHIVNTASMAGLVPTPLTTSYAATKHAVVGLSRSLRLEAAPAGVRVSVLCPGAIRTAILIGGGRFGRLARPVPEETQRQLWEQVRPMDADDFAARALALLACNRALIILPWFWRPLYWLSRLSPALADLLTAQQFARVKTFYRKDP